MGSFQIALCVLYLLSMSVKGYNNSEVKRDLNWVSGNIKSRTNESQIQVKYLKPNSGNPSIADNGDYMAFTLYNPGSNIGEFYFIESNIADMKRSNCKRSTMHAGAYYHFFNKCPEQEVKLVASGFCYQGKNGEGLVFNSETFNSGYSKMTYLNNDYYRNDDRSMNTYEQSLTTQCFNNWKDSGFKTQSFQCDLSGMVGRRRRSTTPVCSDCTCGAAIPYSTGTLFMTILFFFVSLFL